MMLARYVLMLVLLLVGRAPLAQPAGQSDVATTDTVHSQLTSSHVAITPGQTFQVAWDIRLDDHWHVYWSNPGDSGIPPILTPRAEGFVVGNMQWPVPQVITIPPITNYGYEDHVVVLVDVTAPPTLTPGSLNLPVKLEYLYCKDVCMPGRVEVNLPLEVADKAQENPAYMPLRREALAKAPLWEGSMTSWQEGALTVLTVDGLPEMAAPRFIPAEEGWMDDGQSQNVSKNGDVWRLELPADPHYAGVRPAQIKGLLLDGTGKGYGVDIPVGLPPLAKQDGDASAALPLALALAFLAGLMLNLMPCVLPVMALKVFGLVRNPTALGRTAHVLAYTAGVLLCLTGMAGFVALLQSGGAQIGWGFQLQNPLFVAAMCALMVALSLNFWGIFTLGESLTRLGRAAHEESYGEALLTGFLAVLVATPCTVPFMGGAMAYALGQPLMGSLPVFWALGVGMVTPLVLMAVFPPLARLLPKPGMWMHTLKHLLGWPMLATALWLAWVFGKQTDMNLLALLLTALLAMAFGLWLVGVGRLKSGWLLVTLSLLVGAWYIRPMPEQVNPWQPWTKQAEDDARAQGPVLVDFTADWCITCKVVEATVLNRPATQALFAKHNVVLLQGDWTSYDPVITAELEAHGRRGVPLYLLYLPGQSTPQILPQVLTYGILEQALARGATQP